MSYNGPGSAQSQVHGEPRRQGTDWKSLEKRAQWRKYPTVSGARVGTTFREEGFGCSGDSRRGDDYNLVRCEFTSGSLRRGGDADYIGENATASSRVQASKTQIQGRSEGVWCPGRPGGPCLLPR